METAEFDDLFRTLLVERLASLGFEARGKSIFRWKGDQQVALMRGGGRLQVPGAVCHVLGFRHAFLRETYDLTVPTKCPTAPADYPWLLDPSALVFDRARSWPFRPGALMNLPYGRFDYTHAQQAQVEAHLSALRAAIIERFLPWTETLSLRDARNEMSNCRGWWVGRIGFEDYERALERLPVAPRPARGPGRHRKA